MFEIEITPRFGDTDGLKHINNNHITTWFETAENEFYKLFTPDFSLKNSDWKLLLVESESQFIKQTFYGKNVNIKAYIIEVGDDYFITCCEAWQDKELKAIGKNKYLHYDWINLESIIIPDEIETQLIEHLRSTDKIGIWD